MGLRQDKKRVLKYITLNIHPAARSQGLQFLKRPVAGKGAFQTIPFDYINGLLVFFALKMF